MAKKRNKKKDQPLFEDLVISDRRDKIFERKFCRYDLDQQRNICNNFIKDKEEFDKHDMELKRLPKKCYMKRGRTYLDIFEKGKPFEMIFGNLEEMEGCGFENDKVIGLFDNFGDTFDYVFIPYKWKEDIGNRANIKEIAIPTQGTILIGNKLIPTEPLIQLFVKNEKYAHIQYKNGKIGYIDEDKLGVAGKGYVGFRNEDGKILLIKYQKIDDLNNLDEVLKERISEESHEEIKEKRPFQMKVRTEKKIKIRGEGGRIPRNDEDNKLIAELTELEAKEMLSPLGRVWKINNQLYVELSSFNGRFDPKEFEEELGYKSCFSDKNGRIFCEFKGEDIDYRRSHIDSKFTFGEASSELLFVKTSDLIDFINNNGKEGKPYYNKWKLGFLQSELAIREGMDERDLDLENDLRKKIDEIERQLMQMRIKTLEKDYDIKEAMRYTIKGKVNLLGWKKERKLCKMDDNSIIKDTCEPTQLAYEIADKALTELIEKTKKQNNKWRNKKEKKRLFITQIYLMGGFVDERMPKRDKPELLVVMGGLNVKEALSEFKHRHILNDVYVNAVEDRVLSMVAGRQVPIDMDALRFQPIRGQFDMGIPRDMQGQYKELKSYGKYALPEVGNITSSESDLLSKIRKFKDVEKALSQGYIDEEEFNEEMKEKIIEDEDIEKKEKSDAKDEEKSEVDGWDFGEYVG